MNGWTTKQLKDRQRKEIKNVEKKVDTPITTGNTNTNAPSFGTCDEEPNDVGDEEPNDVGDEEMSLEDIVNEVKRNFSVITNAKALINENIFKGFDMFPNNKDLLTLETEHDLLFCVSLSGNILESSLAKASMKEAECKYKRLQPINIDLSKDGDEVNGGNVCVLDSNSKSKTSEVTPEMVKDVVKKLDVSKFKPFQNSLVLANNEEPKAAKQGDDQKLVSNGISKSKIRPRSLNENFLEKTRAKREVKLHDSLKSPYINRIVDCKRRLQLDEKKVSNWLFACTEDENDIVFEAHGQLIGYKGIMESLRPSSKIHASVVDIWVEIQNDIEKRRSTSASSRVFVHSDIMVCFPIVQSGHFYYITFNFIKDEVHVIDNLTVCPNYKELPEKLISKFAGYLTEINHRKAGSIGRIKPIYKGMHKMENGLAREGLVQQEQLNDLRRKYATKILLADINEHKEALERKVSIFDKLTKEEKSILNQHELVVGNHE
uniref:Ulp1 protease family, C-terminal catalytic domain-containing protein n=1 Tax=Tanacetum cinerariifolium TaxID=118510 RepID=A0A6L2JH05_TANCI|nr:ulp1 protease family, C-terminal catalytic domain-containing protein [Tanacetum cinerariifolium]